MLLTSRLSILILLLVFANPGYSESPDKAIVLDRLIQAYGGEDNLRKLDSFIQEWDVQALTGNRRGTDVRSVRLPHQLKVDLTYPDKTEERFLSGDTAYVMFNGVQPREVAGPQRDAMRLQLMRLYSPLMLKSKAGSLSLTQDGGLMALSLVEHGLRADYLVNEEKWRIEKVVGTLTMGGTEMQFVTEYSDFAVVEGVLVHRGENKFAGGVNTARLKLREISFDAELHDSQFSP